MRVAGDVLDHLRVEVGGQERLPLAALAHRHDAHEVGHPHVGRGLELGVLVQEVVDLPALVGDPDVERLLLHEVWKTMKLAQKISSSRRNIWNACRACSPASASTCAASGASCSLAGWTRSPQAASSVVSGGCASQCTSRPGTWRRSSRAMATSRQAWPRPIGEE